MSPPHDMHLQPLLQQIHPEQTSQSISLSWPPTSHICGAVSAWSKQDSGDQSCRGQRNLHTLARSSMCGAQHGPWALRYPLASSCSTA
eukprot:479877-Amphidinium_carterae.1